MKQSFLAAVFTALLLAGCSDQSDTASDAGSVAIPGSSGELTPDLARSLARDAWLFGLPLVMFEKQIDYSTYVTSPGQAKAPINQIAHFRRFVDASERSIVGFNVDNLYSLAWIDLSREPLVLSVPAMGERYWIMQIVDAVPRQHMLDNWA